MQFESKERGPVTFCMRVRTLLMTRCGRGLQTGTRTEHNSKCSLPISQPLAKKKTTHPYFSPLLFMRTRTEGHNISMVCVRAHAVRTHPNSMLFSFLQSVITTWLTRELVIWEAPMRTLCILLCENLTSSFTVLWGKKRMNSFSSRLVKTTMDSTAAARVQGKHVILGINSSAQVNILYIGFLLITT
jgi:hypothetical protein